MIQLIANALTVGALIVLLFLLAICLLAMFSGGPFK